MKKIFIIIFIMCLCGCSNNTTNEEITYEKALNLVNNGAIIIDVRTKSEYNENHIDNAVLLTLDTINESSAKNIIKEKDSIVIVYCKSGNRSKQAQEKLNNLGYTNIYNLGSVDNWEN